MKPKIRKTETYKEKCKGEANGWKNNMKNIQIQDLILNEMFSSSERSPKNILLTLLWTILQIDNLY